MKQASSAAPLTPPWTRLAFFLIVVAMALSVLRAASSALAFEAPWSTALWQLGVSAMVFLLACAVVWGGSLRRLASLRPALAEPTSSATEQAASVALRFPFALALALAPALILALAIAALLEIVVLDIDPLVAFALCGFSAPAILALTMLLYVLAREWIRPLANHLAHEDLPAGRRSFIASRVAVGVVAACLATTIPPAVAQLASAQLDGQRNLDSRRQQLASTIAYGARYQERDQLRELIARIDPPWAHLSIGHPHGTDALAVALPNGDGALVVEREPQRFITPVFALFLALFVVALGGLLGLHLGNTIGREVKRVTHHIRGDKEGDPAFHGGSRLSELQRLNLALDGLVQHTTELHAAHFVAIERMLEADQGRTQFLANMSHDLRSPLNSIIGFSELLERGLEGELNPRQRRTIQTIHRAARELLYVISEVLDVAKVEARRVDLHREDTLPTRILTDAAKLARERSYLAEAEVEIQLQAGLPPISVDGPRLSEALMYLLRHAVNRGAEQLFLGAHREAIYRNRVPEDSLVITMRYRSKDPELKAINGPASRRPGEKGVGMGPWVARCIVDLHDGQLSTSADREQVCIMAELPLRQRKALGRLREVAV